MSSFLAYHFVSSYLRQGKEMKAIFACRSYSLVRNTSHGTLRVSLDVLFVDKEKKEGDLWLVRTPI